MDVLPLVKSYGVELWGGGGASQAFKVYLGPKRANRIINDMFPLGSCIYRVREDFVDHCKLLLCRHFAFTKQFFATVITHLAVQPVYEVHRFPTRHGGNLRTNRHRLALNESQSHFCAGIEFSNKLPLDVIKKSKGEIFETIEQFLINYFFLNFPLLL